MSFFVDEVRFQVVSGDGGAGAISFRRKNMSRTAVRTAGTAAKAEMLSLSPKATCPHCLILRENRFSVPGRDRMAADGVCMAKMAMMLLSMFRLVRGLRIPIRGNVCMIFPIKQTANNGYAWWAVAGGQGNWHFRSSRNHVPRFAQPGMPGTECSLNLELAFIADVGLLGLPNAGKSSLINAVTATQSKVGAYPFTTKIPHLGVYRRGNKEIILADIPGLVEGASSGYEWDFSSCAMSDGQKSWPG